METMRKEHIKRVIEKLEGNQARGTGIADLFLVTAAKQLLTELELLEDQLLETGVSALLAQDALWEYVAHEESEQGMLYTYWLEEGIGAFPHGNWTWAETLRAIRYFPEQKLARIGAGVDEECLGLMRRYRWARWALERI